MVRRTETDPIDRDERLGEAIEAFLALAEGGHPPALEDFAARYPELDGDLKAALEGLALVRGLVGEAEGPGHRLESGRRIAGYRIVRELGRGGMGTVYEAVHVGLDRPVALKVLGAHAAPDSTGRRRFLNEAKTAAGLHHTHIVPVFDVGQVGGLCYYAMQRIEGSGLDLVLRHLRRDRSVAAGSSSGGTSPSGGGSGWLGRTWRRRAVTIPEGLAGGLDDETASWIGRSRGGTTLPAGPGPAGRDLDDEPTPFDPPRGSAYYRWVAEVGRQAAEALAHAHRRGIIHRDVKPSNLLVDAKGTVWVADFGLARRLADPALTQHDSLLGTPRYMSPEQARTGPIDGRTDVYSLGATLYELLTLRPPFQGKTAAELVDQIAGREPPTPRQTDHRIPRDLETIVLKCLAKRPADRYAQAIELAEDLERFLHFEPVRARRISPVGRLWRLARRHPSTTAVSAAAAATVIAVATTAYIRVLHERDLAWAANRKTEAAKLETEAANQEMHSAMRMQLLDAAKVARHSNFPNRRTRGLSLLKEAAALRPDPELRARLRDVAAEFFVLRDVEARPEFATGPARGVVFGPEGTRLGALSADGRVFSLWNVNGRKRLDRHVLDAGRLDRGSSAGAGGPSGGPPGGSRRGYPGIASAGSSIAVVRPGGPGLRLFDVANGAPTRDLDLPPGRMVLSVLATPGGHRLVTIESVLTAPRGPAAVESGPSPTRGRGGFGTEVRLYDPEQFDRPIATLARWTWEPGPSGRGGEVPLVAIGPDGKTVATTRTRETTVELWAADDGRSLGTIETQVELTALAVGPFGLLATAGGGEVRLWEVDSKLPLPGLAPYQSYIRLLKFNPRGTLLALGGFGPNVEVWDPSSHEVVAVLPTPDRPDDLAFAPDGRTLAAGQGTTTTVWAIVDPLARTQISGFDSRLTALAFGGDDLLAMGTSKGTIRSWQPGHCPSATQQVHVASAAGPADRVGGDKPVSLAFDDQGRLLALDVEKLRCWADPPEFSKLTQSSLPRMPGGWGRMMHVPLLARVEGGRTLCLARGSRILVWHADEPERWRPVTLPPLPEPSGFDRRRMEPPPWRQVAASPDGRRLYLIAPSSDVLALALDGTQARRLDWELPTGSTSLAVSPDGSLLAIGDRQGHVTLVDTKRGTVRSRLGPGAGEAEGPTFALAFSPDGRVLAVGSQQGQVTLWAPGGPSAPLLHLPGHRGNIVTLAYDPNGRYLASAGSDQVVDVWDLDSVRGQLAKLGLAW